MKATMTQHVWRVMVTVSLSLLCLASAFAQDTPRLGKPEDASDRQTLKQQETAGRHELKILLDNPAGGSIQLLRVNPEVVNKSTGLLSVPLADGRLPQFKLRNYIAPESLGDAGVTSENVAYTPAAYWFGYGVSDDKARSPTVSNDNVDASSFIFLARRGNSLRGRMVVNGQLYLLEDVGKGQHGLMEVNEALGLPCDVLENEPENEPVEPKKLAEIKPTMSGTKSRHEIKVLLVTTQAAGQMRNPSAADIMTDEIMYFSEMGDQGAGLALKLSVVKEFGSTAQDSLLHKGKDILDDFRNQKTRATQEVAALRDSVRADVVIVGAVHVESKEVTYQGARKNTAFYVFNVRAPQYFFHGFGHLMGIRHVWKEGDMDLDPPYQHGFLSREYEGKRYASIGFDPKDCVAPGCEIVHRWSDPGLNLHFGRFGDPQHADEIRYLNERVVDIENFY
ncbi:hypothetical protein OP492_05950 [Pseudomonas mosselii]|uniref:hypothetical protein n=1 Tax=Pseudomonas mosselii TaxID=78327 RepID=UPI0021A2A8B5|nr:hypothetical protein [Pseudomonas mosselii]MEA3234189.1 hypothetical protein [Pseudomonas mosselii]UWS67527.1 hypothetical protein N0U38_01610 [Pseudomonas mosselii]